MTAAVPTTAVALMAMLLVVAAISCAYLATRPSPARPSAHRIAVRGALDGVDTIRIVIATAIAVGVAVVTHWLVLSIVAGVLSIAWRRLLRDERAEAERAHVEGIAKWLEDLRDTLRGSSVGTEEALENVALRAPEAVREPLATFALRRRQGFRTEDALTDLADALAHPTSDAAIAAIRLVVTGTAGSGRLFRTVDSLAAAARDEVRARERVDRTRAVYRSSMTRLVVIAGLIVGYLRLAAGDLLQPYDSPTGQLVLVVPLAMWGGCLVWLRSLCRYEVPGRYRIAGSAT